MRRNEKVSKIMTASPATVQSGQKLSEVSTLMRDGQFHHVPVVDGKKLVGMLTSTDLLRVSYEYGVDPRQTDTVLDHTTAITDLMKTEVVTLGENATVRDAVQILSEGKFHSLPIVNDAGELQGIVTTTDLLRYVMEQY